MSRCLTYSKSLGALVVLAALGCGNKNLVSVKGVVTLDGQPVEGALVKFVPKGDGGSHGHEATAVTDDSGHFSLGTLAEGDGAWRGVYKVCVQKIIIDPAMQAKMPELGGAAEDDQKAAQANRAQIMKAMRYKKNIFPKKYMNANSTPIEVTVPTNEEVRIDIKSEEEKGAPAR
jgi:hypothetical protein